MKPHIHAESSAKNFGGKPSDYFEIHQWFDQTKSHFGSNVHRAILHNSFGIFLAESFFGVTIKNSDGKEISVRDISEQHVIEDLGFIPTLGDYLENLQYQPWMSREKDSEKPSSQKPFSKKEAEETEKILPDLRKNPLDPFSPFKNDEFPWEKYPTPITPQYPPFPPKEPKWPFPCKPEILD